MRIHRIQCKACPWKVSTDPDTDIPGGYSRKKHENLENTIADPGPSSLLNGVRHVMACHESPPGEEQACAGWVAHQLGPGNNLGLRLMMFRDPEAFDLVLDGEQHERFEDTLPKRRAAKKKTRKKKRENANPKQ